MNKAQKLTIVFDFIAEYLREDEPAKAVKQEPKLAKAKSFDLYETEADETPVDEKVLGVPSSKILDMMEKIEKIDRLKPSFDEPLLRKGIPEELRDNNEVESTHKTHLSMEPTYEKLESGAMGVVMKPKVEIVKA